MKQKQTTEKDKEKRSIQINSFWKLKIMTAGMKIHQKVSEIQLKQYSKISAGRQRNGKQKKWNKKKLEK